MAPTRRFVATLLVLASLTAPLAACGGDNGENATGPVEVTLKDHQIDDSRAKAQAGTVRFDIRNEGPSEHEFLVIRTDLSPDSLPTDEENAVDEKGEGLEFIDEVEGIKAGTAGALVLDLEPGRYVLLCNLEDHYQKQMYTTFDVVAPSS